jgi:predicted SprT family Zn-dependent metalloprotease
MTSEEKLVDSKFNYKCRKCGSGQVFHYTWESSDGAHEDEHYRCEDCKAQWWVEGSDY